MLVAVVSVDVRCRPGRERDDRRRAEARRLQQQTFQRHQRYAWVVYRLGEGTRGPALAASQEVGREHGAPHRRLVDRKQALREVGRVFIARVEQVLQR